MLVRPKFTTSVDRPCATVVDEPFPFARRDKARVLGPAEHTGPHLHAPLIRPLLALAFAGRTMRVVEGEHARQRCLLAGNLRLALPELGSLLQRVDASQLAVAVTQ